MACSFSSKPLWLPHCPGPLPSPDAYIWKGRVESVCLLHWLLQTQLHPCALGSRFQSSLIGLPLTLSPYQTLKPTIGSSSSSSSSSRGWPEMAKRGGGVWGGGEGHSYLDTTDLCWHCAYGLSHVRHCQQQEGRVRHGSGGFTAICMQLTSSDNVHMGTNWSQGL